MLMRWSNLEELWKINEYVKNKLILGRMMSFVVGFVATLPAVFKRLEKYQNGYASPAFQTVTYVIKEQPHKSLLKIAKIA